MYNVVKATLGLVAVVALMSACGSDGGGPDGGGGSEGGGACTLQIPELAPDANIWGHSPKHEAPAPKGG